MWKCQLSVVDEKLTNLMYHLGVLIGKYPLYFIIIPVLLAALGVTGFQRLKYEEDPEYLFSPVNGRAKYERHSIEDHFPMNYSGHFNIGRVTRLGKFAKVIMKPKNSDENMLKQEIWKEMLEIDSLVHNISISFYGRNYSYKDICARIYRECFENNILQLYDLLPDIEKGDYKLTYPVSFDPVSFETYVIPLFFGSTKINDLNQILSVPAVTLLWVIATNSDEEISRGTEWEIAFLDKMAEMNDRWQTIDVTWFASKTMEIELEKNTISVIPFILYTSILMIMFCITTSMMRDPVRSKPFLGMLGLISAGIATAASFGVIIYCGMSFVGINIAAPFLMMGIGIDDSFVMIAAWRRTKIQDSVPERLGKTYSEAAVSVTITTLTDVLSFWIGTITPFPSVQIFSFYTGTAVVFTYIFHLTFFGGCMAISGYREQNNIHSLTLKKTIPLSEAVNQSLWYRMCCAGGISSKDPYNSVDNVDHCIMKFFGDKLGKTLNFPVVKAIVIVIFVIYFSVACWGLTKIEEGLERKKLSRYDSYSSKFYEWEDTYFSQFPYRVQVLITGELNYSNRAVRDKVNQLLTDFENYEHVGKGFTTESWIRSFEKFKQKRPELINKTYESEAEFIKDLREKFIPRYENSVGLDLHFNENYTKILATRYILQVINKTDLNDDRIIMETLREISDGSSLNVSVSHPFFIFFDQFILVRSTTIQSITIAAVIMMIVSLIFIPNPFCCLWIAFSIISIEIGVIGYMALWKVNLDSISMINLIMCIGFSVDFSAHISYAYMSNPSKNPDIKVRESLYNLGLPIVQGSISTLLAITALPFAPSYIFITFFKVIFLVIFFGAIHGLFLLPVLLSLLGPDTCNRKTKENIKQTNTNSTRSMQSPVNGHIYYISTPSQIPKSYFTYNGPYTSRNNSNFTSWDQKCTSAEKDLGLGTSGEDSTESCSSKMTNNVHNKEGIMCDSDLKSFNAKNQQIKNKFPKLHKESPTPEKNNVKNKNYSDFVPNGLMTMSQFDVQKYKNSHINLAYTSESNS